MLTRRCVVPESRLRTSPAPLSLWNVASLAPSGALSWMRVLVPARAVVRALSRRARASAAYPKPKQKSRIGTPPPRPSSQEVARLGMLPHQGFDARAPRDHLHPLAAHVGERTREEPRANTSSAHRRGHRRVHERDPAARGKGIDCNREPTIDLQLVATAGRVVANGCGDGHGLLQTLAGPIGLGEGVG